MTMESSLLAIIRSARPTFRTKEDKLTFAIHAYLLSQNYKLIAVGPPAEDESTDWTSPRDEIDHQGWNNNSVDGYYTFRYQDIDNQKPPLYVKCMVAGGKLLLHWTSGSGRDTSSSSLLELNVDSYTADNPIETYSYKNLSKLIELMQQSKLGLTAQPTQQQHVASGPGSSSSRGGGLPSSSSQSRPEYSSTDDPLRIGPPRRPVPGYGSPGMPLGVGTEDVVPPGVRPPGYHDPPLPGFGEGEFHPPGNLPSGPHRGGGMHVGPGDPIFGPGRYGRGVGGGRGGGEVLPPGARWDPIAPEGLPGAHPEDYIPETGPRIHPDVMQPGPGNGGSFDSMFG